MLTSEQGSEENYFPRPSQFILFATYYSITKAIRMKRTRQVNFIGVKVM
jgi:hypothetical protein